MSFKEHQGAKIQAVKARTSPSARANRRSVADDIWLHLLLEHQVHNFQRALSRISNAHANAGKERIYFVWAPNKSNIDTKPREAYGS